MSRPLARVTTEATARAGPVHTPLTAVPDVGYGGPGIAAHRLRDGTDVTDSLQRMSSESLNEILAMLPATGDTTALARLLSARREQDLDPVGRGVDSLLICEAPLLDDRQVRAELEQRVEAGVRVRVLERMTQWVALFDRRVAVLPAVPARVGQESLVVRERAMVSSLHSLFAGLWHRSVDLDRHRDQDRSSRDRQVLSLMGSGVTDETAAREMDVSVRTYRRYVADLMTALGASSRFQAGVRAAGRGWA